MATRSLIGIELSNGSIQYVYCHWDGYPEHNGHLLQEHYQERDKVLSLLAQGDMSCLGERINPEPDKPHTFGDVSRERQEGVCMFYGRDRGEKDTAAGTVPSRTAFLARDHWQEFYYLYTDSGWVVSDGGKESKPLADVLAAAEAA